MSGTTVAKRITLSAGTIDALDNFECYHRFPPHFHDTFAVGVIDSGFHRFVTPRGTWLAGPGCILAIAPGETHSVGALSRGGYTYRMLYPTVEFMSRLNDNVRRAGASFAVFREPVLRDPAIFADLSSALQGALTSPDASDFEHPLLNALSACVERYLSPEHGVSDSSGRVRDLVMLARAQEFLRQHLPEPVLLSSVADHCGIGEYQLNRLFVRLVGVPPHAYLVQLRVNRARALLSNGHSIAEATYTCGFSDQSHLNRLFKRTIGVPPGRFRRSLVSAA